MTTALPAVAKLISVGNGLPRLSFRQIDGPGMISWSQGPTASVVFIPHRGECEECGRYLEVLGSVAEGLREWATRAMVLCATGPGSGGSGAECATSGSRVGPPSAGAEVRPPAAGSEIGPAVARSLAEHRAPGVLMLVDVDGAGRARLGIGEDHAAIIQADRWGAVYQVEVVGRAAGAHATLPAGRDLVALAQLIDIQCPECAIPSKEWLEASPYPLG